MAQTLSISETLRRGIADSGMSLCRLADLADVDDARLSRFMRQERGLSLATVDRVCRVLGLRLVPEGKATKAKSRKKRVTR